MQLENSIFKRLAVIQKGKELILDYGLNQSGRGGESSRVGLRYGYGCLWLLSTPSFRV